MRALRVFGAFALGIGATSLTACRREVISCAIARAAISVSVSDSVSGADGPFSNVIAVATGSVFKDSVLFALILPSSAGAGNPKQIQLAFNEPDTYSVTVIADGYKQWSKSNVSAPPDNQCPSRPVNQLLHAKLLKAP
jgi:hypothetical protein